VKETQRQRCERQRGPWGAGKFTWADGTFYDGAWRDDKAHGQGANGSRGLAGWWEG
jgi:hypothetical protein